jgi:hypothetical protein
MTRTILVAILWFGITGCGLLRPSSTEVELVNNGDFTVEVRIFISDEQKIPAGLIDDLGDELNFTVAAGQRETFSRSCDDLQAVVVDEADLQVALGLGPDASSEVLRDGTDFGCGDGIRFTFTHNEVLTDLQISVAVDQR